MVAEISLDAFKAGGGAEAAAAVNSVDKNKAKINNFNKRKESFIKGFGARDPIDLNMKSLLKAGGVGAAVGGAYTMLDGSNDVSDVTYGAGLATAGLASWKAGKSLATGIWSGFKGVKEHDAQHVKNTMSQLGK